MKTIVIGLAIVMSFFIGSTARADCPRILGDWAGTLRCACDCSCSLPISVPEQVTITNQNGCFFKGEVWVGGAGNALTGRIDSATHAIDAAVGFNAVRGTLVKTINGYTQIKVVAPVVEFQYNTQCTCSGTYNKQ